MPVFGLTIFIGAFLLFQVQPLIAKYILPWFGGGPGVWTTCMLFFQVLLLGGYAYAHLTSRWLRPRAQVILHLFLLLTALALLPITPSNSWKPTGAENPTGRILALLFASLGLPYLVLSTTGPLLQQWFNRVHPGRSPYRLYALSNVGSLLALLSYPAFFENHFTRKTQATLWGMGLIAFVICCAFCAFKVWKEDKPPEPGSQSPQLVTHDSANKQRSAQTTPDHAPRTTVLTRLLWLLLPACASILLLATTNKLCQDVAVIPFLWVLPLGLYLLSFIICFDNPRWYARGPFAVALVFALAATCWVLGRRTETGGIFVHLSIYSIGLFICCMVCHGELYRLRPDPRQLTAFYLLIAAGGALGGVLVAAVAPLVFADYYELHFGLLGCGLLFLVVWVRNSLPAWGPGFSRSAGQDQSVNAHLTTLAAAKYRSWIAGAMALGLLVLAAGLWTQSHRRLDGMVERSRNFYGVLTVRERAKGEGRFHRFLLDHGPTTHGLQFVDPVLALRPTAYFSERSGVGLALRALPPGNRRVGIVGLGAGTLASYARTGDYFRIYEINPEVKRLASTHFTYLSDCEGRLEIALGDARLSLEREPPQHFDVLVLDAFNSDAIPVHLLTAEAFGVYERHLKPDGLIALHISNACLDLEPVVLELARQLNYHAAVIPYGTDQGWIFASTWILLSHSGAIIDSQTIREAARPPQPNSEKVRPWSDDFASLFQILGRGTACELKSDLTAAHCLAAANLTDRHDYAGAIATYRRAVECDPDFADALNNLAWLLAVNPNPSLRNGAEAVQLAERACQLARFRQTNLIGTLAAAYAEAGRFDEAIATAQRACTLAASRVGEQALLEKNQQLLDLYRAHKPYHEAD